MVWVSCCDSTWKINWIDQWNVWDVHEKACETDLLIPSNSWLWPCVYGHTHTNSPAAQRCASTPKNPTLELTTLGGLRWISTCVGPTVTQTQNNPRGVSGCLIYQHLPGGGSADSCGFQGGASIDWTSSCSNWSLGSWEGGALSSLLTWFCGRAGSSILHDFTHSMGVLCFFFFFLKEIRSICMHAGFSQELGILHECSHIRVQTFETY